MKLTGNVVSDARTGYGTLEWQNGTITALGFSGEPQADAPWIVPGFIDVHLHGAGMHSVEGGERGLRGMAEFLASKGVTRFLPTYSCAPHEELLAFVKTVRRLAEEPPPGALIAGAHLEGPWLAPRFCGGMLPEMIRKPDIKQAREYVEAAAGSLKMMTIAPEGPGAEEVIRFLHENGVVVSAGHTACPPPLLDKAIQAGVSEICHLFDCWELPESCGGVRQPALTDLALIHDGVMKEIIMDGLHVPRELVMLARRAAGADHIIAITDALQGAGLPEGRFVDCGKPYVIRDGEFARRVEDDVIIGSSLSMNRAFFNMTARFGFTPAEAVKAASGNPARQLGIADRTGTLAVGMAADVAVLASDRLTVQETWLAGKQIY